MRIAASLLAIMLVLPNVAQADEQAPREVGRILDVPGLGEVSVPEQGYREIRDLLNSDDPADHERALALLQGTQNEESDGSDDIASQSTGPISVLPPGVFAVRHPQPPAGASSSAAASNAPDLAEPLDHLPTKSRERLW
jgi:hypothetical protein